MDEKYKTSSWVGIIPDFFHDILAYLVPGYTALILFAIDSQLAKGQSFQYFLNDGIVEVFSSLVIAYVAGRALEQLGYFCIHSHRFVFKKTPKEKKPKWSLLFDKKDDFYTEMFKKTVKEKVATWLELQNGYALIDDCEKNGKDEYFNLIQFYLRERFPAVALYEKKQNAAIVLSRSLAIIFFINILIYYAILGVINNGWCNLHFNPAVLFWLSLNFIVSWIFYFRYVQDNRYHAMYIFETFIATKRLLKKKKMSDPNAIV